MWRVFAYLLEKIFKIKMKSVKNENFNSAEFSLIKNEALKKSFTNLMIN